MGTGAMNPPGNGLAWRVERLEEERPKNENARDLTAKHETELHGEVGVFKRFDTVEKRFDAQDARLARINATLWMLTAAVIGAAVTIALAVH